LKDQPLCLSEFFRPPSRFFVLCFQTDPLPLWGRILVLDTRFGDTYRFGIQRSRKLR
jgi:hypothetical protein